MALRPEQIPIHRAGQQIQQLPLVFRRNAGARREAENMLFSVHSELIGMLYHASAALYRALRGWNRRGRGIAPTPAPSDGVLAPNRLLTDERQEDLREADLHRVALCRARRV